MKDLVDKVIQSSFDFKNAWAKRNRAKKKLKEALPFKERELVKLLYDDGYEIAFIKRIEVTDDGKVNYTFLKMRTDGSPSVAGHTPRASNYQVAKFDPKYKKEN